MSTLDFDLPETRERITYAFGHLASAEMYPDDAHAGDSRDLAMDVFQEIGLTVGEIAALHVAAEWVGTLEGLVRA